MKIEFVVHSVKVSYAVETVGDEVLPDKRCTEIVITPVKGAVQLSSPGETMGPGPFPALTLRYKGESKHEVDQKLTLEL